MNTRSRFVLTLTLLFGLSLPHDAAANPGDSRLYATHVDSRAALDRKFESAMLHMDRNLVALLGSRTMDCTGEDSVGEMDICWVSLEFTRAVDAPRGPVGQ
jgi:hypothetical protein